MKKSAVENKILVTLNQFYSLNSTKKFGQGNKILCDFNKTILFYKHLFSECARHSNFY